MHRSLQVGYVTPNSAFVRKYTPARPDDVSHFEEVFLFITDHNNILSQFCQLCIVQFELDYTADYLLLPNLKTSLLLPIANSLLHKKCKQCHESAGDCGVLTKSPTQWYSASYSCREHSEFLCERK